MLDKAVFGLTIGSLSPILEDERGFHIIRVVERKDLTRKAFGEVQSEIKKRIKSEREGKAVDAYIAALRKKVKVWTIFDDLPMQASKPSEGTRR
jgi:parvulin-like peptidyl-prolyl isomerase